VSASYFQLVSYHLHRIMFGRIMQLTLQHVGQLHVTHIKFRQEGTYGLKESNLSYLIWISRCIIYILFPLWRWLVSGILRWSKDVRICCSDIHIRKEAQNINVWSWRNIAFLRGDAETTAQIRIEAGNCITFFCNAILFPNCTSSFSKLWKKRTQWHIE
jgi:hypothetical protein